MFSQCGPIRSLDDNSLNGLPCDVTTVASNRQVNIYLISSTHVSEERPVSSVDKDCALWIRTNMQRNKCHLLRPNTSSQSWSERHEEADLD